MGLHLIYELGLDQDLVLSQGLPNVQRTMFGSNAHCLS